MATMTVDAVQLVGLGMAEPIREDGLYRYTVRVKLALMTLVEGRLQYIDGLALAAARVSGWAPEVRIDLPLAETADSGSPSIAEVGQTVLGAAAQAVEAAQQAWLGVVIDLGVTRDGQPVGGVVLDQPVEPVDEGVAP